MQKEFDDAKSTLETAEASYKQMLAQVNEAKLNLGYTKVVAPIDGVTGIANKSNGNLITAADSLLTTIVQTDPVYINFSIPEADYLKVAKEVGSGKVALPGKRASNGSLAFDVQLKLADGSMFPTTGKMNFISEKVNPATGGFDARAQVANPEGNLRPGQFVRVILAGAKRSAALAVPQRARWFSQYLPTINSSLNPSSWMAGHMANGLSQKASITVSACWLMALSKPMSQV